MQPRLIILVLAIFASTDLWACSYCRSKVPQGAQGAQPAAAPSGGGAMVVRGVGAAKSAVNLNDNGFWAVKEEDKVVSERGTYDMVVSPSEIYGN